ncbi:DUF7352 domain-containing protein [Ketobacter alkanivorans]|uniref:DUF7352 domain-containing protein n=1 Tax=Ketobacter alkanivorans TaxID=1917421 RepID=A0A2K9LU20_9GAMM|nr:hypothetical protein [Ketobacter alkanivorans]AUM14995.1 hypothetical protein Kalk_16500 [Ketobacter alkanivorans]MCP5017927.1 hypothetical protein [Ketobacter sp.]
MRTIHKFEVPISKETQTIDLPEKATIVHVEYLMPRRTIYMWAEVPADMTAPKSPRQFRVFLTGDGIPNNASYLGSTIDQYLPEAYHVYELLA